jgi:hypothetical protein
MKISVIEIYRLEGYSIQFKLVTSLTFDFNRQRCP